MKQEKDTEKEIKRFDFTLDNMLWAESMRGRIVNIVITSSEVEEQSNTEEWATRMSPASK